MARISKLLLLLVLCVAWPIQALAETADEAPDLDQIRTQQKELREMAVAGKGPFDGFSEVKRAQIAEKQDSLLRLLEGRAAYDDLSENQKMQAFNLLQWIQASLSGDEGDQLVCDYVQRTGSNRRTRRCETIEERRRARDESKQYWQHNLQRAFCWYKGQPCGMDG